jgi:hypothetical protein
MLRNRFLILLGAGFLAASSAWADDVGFIDCSSHPEGTQVFGKPRKTPDVLASVPCGERFTVLVYGFVFSRIQTGDGTVGYVYSNVIAVDRAATAAQQTGSLQIAAVKTKIPSPRPPAANPAPPAATPSQPAPQQVVTSAPVATSPEPVSPAPASPAPAESLAPVTNIPAASAPVAAPDPPAPSQPQPVAAQPPAAPAPVTSAPMTPAPAATTNVPETTAAVAKPDPPAPAPAPPQPAPVQPAAPPIRPADARSSWEKPLPTARNAPKVEVFGGFAFARLVSAGSTPSNLNGAMGSLGWNPKPWLQIVGDSSYSFVTVGGTKNVLYGNHFGPRYFHRSRNRWGATPFVEGLVGGSRSDTTTAGATNSVRCLSFKVGGGLDLRPSRRWEIRLFDVDYYRTAFGTNLHQNNYWASAGIVLRLFGGSSDY